MRPMDDSRNSDAGVTGGRESDCAVGGSRYRKGGALANGRGHHFTIPRSDTFPLPPSEQRQRTLVAEAIDLPGGRGP